MAERYHDGRIYDKIEEKGLESSFASPERK
jgi:hypothetical protein